MWYPSSEGGDLRSPIAELTGLRPDVYREVLKEWPLKDFLIWLERSRVRRAFDDIT
jgi:hypothetical protein